jgi:hypothetical protein
MRGRYALCAYVGLAPDAPQAGWPADLVPLEVHGGLGWSALGDDDPHPAGWWWYGWDYGHAFDRTWMEWEMRDAGIRPPQLGAYFDSSHGLPPETTWEIPMVAEQARVAAEAMMALVLAGWRPSDADQSEQWERDRRMAEYIEDMASGRARATMDAEAKKARRLRELEG